MTHKPNPAIIEREVYRCLVSGTEALRVPWKVRADQQAWDRIVDLVVSDNRCAEQAGEVPQLCLRKSDHSGPHGFDLSPNHETVLDLSDGATL